MVVNHYPNPIEQEPNWSRITRSFCLRDFKTPPKALCLCHTQRHGDYALPETLGGRAGARPLSWCFKSRTLSVSATVTGCSIEDERGQTMARPATEDRPWGSHTPFMLGGKDGFLNRRPPHARNSGRRGRVRAVDQPKMHPPYPVVPHKSYVTIWPTGETWLTTQTTPEAVPMQLNYISSIFQRYSNWPWCKPGPY